MRRLLNAILYTLITNTIFAQETKPELLKQPENWEFERFSLPPSFAPGITYKGFEELRFAPGMFKKDSADYFSYAFVASIDSIKNISQNDIQAYLLRYYRGLCRQVANDRKLAIDTSKVMVENINKKATSAEVIYYYTVNAFGVFVDGAPVKLNMEVKVIKDAMRNKLYLFFITSPKPNTSAVWEKLYQIRTDFKIPSS